MYAGVGGGCAAYVGQEKVAELPVQFVELFLHHFTVNFACVEAIGSMVG